MSATKRKLPQKLGQPMVKHRPRFTSKGHLNESETVVSSGGNAARTQTNGTQISIEISSDDEKDGVTRDADSEDGSASEADADAVMEDADNTADIPDANDEEAGEPSFGDLVRANASEPIDVASAFEDPANAISYPQNTQIQAPSGASLGTVLTQALKTNDVSLLESCLHTTEVSTIRATIQRLESPLAGILLGKLAERLHRRPGRAGSLMVWVQWTLVTHGGSLATQKDLMKQLADLNKVIAERAKGLQSLLSLKGKLDMLEAQNELRKSLQNSGRRGDEEEDDDGVIYVEGQESEQEDGAAVNSRSVVVNGDFLDDDDEDSGMSEDMPMTNGVIADSEDEEEDSSDEDDLIDDIAEETDADTGDEDEIDHDDQDSEDEDESDDGVQTTRPSKVPKTGMFSKKR